MNFLILNHYAGSDRYGMEFRPLYLGRELVKLGHSVTVIAADHSHLRKENPVVGQDLAQEWIDGVRYLWFKTPEYSGNGLSRFRNMLTYLHKLKKYRKRIFELCRPDAIIASSTYPYDVKAAKRIAALGERVKVCYEIHDIWPLSLIELYHLSTKNPYIMSLQRAENYAYRNADLVISILPHVDRHIRELGFEGVRYIHVPNGIVVPEGEMPPAPEEIAVPIAKLREKGKFLLMYLGGFALANALDDLLDSAKELPEQIELVLIGGGPLKAEYEQRVAEEGLSNVSILPAVRKTEVPAALALADALYIGAKRSPLYRYGVGMNKIFDYMLAKKPILYGIESSNDPVAEADCGITIPPEDAHAVAAGAAQLAALPEEERVRMGENGFSYVLEHHDYRALAKRFAAAFEEDAL